MMGAIKDRVVERRNRERRCGFACWNRHGNRHARFVGVAADEADDQRLTGVRISRDSRGGHWIASIFRKGVGGNDQR